MTWGCPSSLPPARHPKPPGLNLQHQLPICALYALHASMDDVPSPVRQGPTFEHACTFVKVCVQTWLGGGPSANRCPRVLTSSRVPVSSQLRRAAHQEPGGGPVQPKQKQSPFASRSVQRALLKRRRASTVRAIAAVKSALRAACQPRQEAGGGCHRKQQTLAIQNRPLAGGRF